MFNRYPAILFISLLLIACRSQTRKMGTEDSVTKPFNMESVSGQYTGLFPCADCSGLRIDLILKPDSLYVLKRNYIAAPIGDTTFVEKGEWLIRKGEKYQSDVLICILSPGDSLKKQLYKIVTHDSLQQLDRHGRTIDSPFNTYLSRVPKVIR